MIKTKTQQVEPFRIFPIMAPETVDWEMEQIRNPNIEIRNKGPITEGRKMIETNRSRLRCFEFSLSRTFANCFELRFGEFRISRLFPRFTCASPLS